MSVTFELLTTQEPKATTQEPKAQAPHSQERRSQARSQAALPRSSSLLRLPVDSDTRLQVIDQARHAGRPQSICDVHHGTPVRTGVEHAQQWGDAAEACAVSNARRNRNNGHADQTTDDAGQRAFHS